MDRGYDSNFDNFLTSGIVLDMVTVVGTYSGGHAHYAIDYGENVYDFFDLLNSYNYYVHTGDLINNPPPQGSLLPPPPKVLIPPPPDDPCALTKNFYNNLTTQYNGQVGSTTELKMLTTAFNDLFRDQLPAGQTIHFSTDLPQGQTLSADGRFGNNYAVTQPQGTSSYIYISPAAINAGFNALVARVGHEVVHALTNADPNLDSEYLAQTYQASIFARFGDANMASFYINKAEATKNANPNFNAAANANYALSSLPKPCQ
jgi:hypothetical protein